MGGGGGGGGVSETGNGKWNEKERKEIGFTKGGGQLEGHGQLMALLNG